MFQADQWNNIVEDSVQGSQPSHRHYIWLLPWQTSCRLWASLYPLLIRSQPPRQQTLLYHGYLTSQLASTSLVDALAINVATELRLLLHTSQISHLPKPVTKMILWARFQSQILCGTVFSLIISVLTREQITLSRITRLPKFTDHIIDPMSLEDIILQLPIVFIPQLPNEY